MFLCSAIQRAARIAFHGTDRTPRDLNVPLDGLIGFLGAENTNVLSHGRCDGPEVYLSRSHNSPVGFAQVICVYVVIPSSCLNIILICIKIVHCGDLWMNILNKIACRYWYLVVLLFSIPHFMLLLFSCVCLCIFLLYIRVTVSIRCAFVAF